jgi:transposase
MLVIGLIDDRKRLIAMKNFRCGRDFVAWLGLVPIQFSSGGKDACQRALKIPQK